MEIKYIGMGYFIPLKQDYLLVSNCKEMFLCLKIEQKYIAKNFRCRLLYLVLTYCLTCQSDMYRTVTVDFNPFYSLNTTKYGKENVNVL